MQQYRHGVEKFLLELPAGNFHPDQESPETAMGRELEEETGYQAQALISLGQIFDNSVRDQSRLHLFLAPQVTPTGTKNCITEDVEAVSAIALFWHFVDGLWIVLFILVYLLPS